MLFKLESNVLRDYYLCNSLTYLKAFIAVLIVTIQFVVQSCQYTVLLKIRKMMVRKVARFSNGHELKMGIVILLHNCNN